MRILIRMFYFYVYILLVGYFSAFLEYIQRQHTLALSCYQSPPLSKESSICLSIEPDQAQNDLN